MKKRVTALLASAALAVSIAPLAVPVQAERADNATYYMPAADQGIVLEPSKEGEPYYEYDGGGIREGIVNKVGDTYYLFYDGAATHADPCSGNDPQNHLWRACLAKSTDLVNWEKLGPRLFCGYDFDPDSGPDEYKDFYSASSPWAYFNEEDNHWYLFYLGAEGAAPSGEDIGTPAIYYSTLIAKAKTEGPEGIEGEYQQYNQLPGQSKAVALWEKPSTASPGSVIENPRWQGPEDTENKRYMMFVTRGDQIWIARSNDLDAVHAWDEPGSEDGWQFDGQILDKTGKTAPENATIFHDEKTGWYYLFTNQFANSMLYTDCNIVYWTKDPNEWDPAHCAVVNDNRSSKDDWATGAIGMPSVVQVDEDTVAIIYDAQEGPSTAHTGRKLGLAYWDLPRLAEDGTPLDFKPQDGSGDNPVDEDEIFINDNDASIVYTGSFIYDQGSPQNMSGDVHYSNTGGTIEYMFTGTGIKWIGQKVYNRGDAEVFIDDVSQGVFSQYDDGIKYQQIIFEISGLAPGAHTIKIVNKTEYTCVDGFAVTPLPEEESSITIGQKELTLEEGGTQKLTYTAVPENAEVEFVSSDPNIATVDADGTVHAVSPGTATVTVKIKDTDISDSCTVTVTEKDDGQGGENPGGENPGDGDNTGGENPGDGDNTGGNDNTGNQPAAGDDAGAGGCSGSIASDAALLGGSAAMLAAGAVCFAARKRKN